jgi:glycosyltransferase 2 family protein
LMLWFIRDTLVTAAAQLKAHTWQLTPSWLLLAGVFYALALLPGCWFWFRTLRVLGQEVRPTEVLRAHSISHLGKYVPGKATVVILRTALVRSTRVHLGIVAASVFFETLTAMSAGAMLGAGILAAHLASGELRVNDQIGVRSLVLGALAVMAIAGLPTLPPVFRRLVSWVGVTRGDPDTIQKLRDLRWGTLGIGWAASTTGWVLLGCSLWATFRAVGVDEPGPIAAMGDYQAAMALATVAGFLSMIPAGLGVRDVVLVSLLVMFFSVPEGIAVVTACLLRITWLTTELAISGPWWFFSRGEVGLAFSKAREETLPTVGNCDGDDT